MQFSTAPQFAREMRPGEETAAEQLLLSAFPGRAEADLVRQLRKDRVIAGETVIPMGDRIIGYYALSYLVRPKGWLVLAPVAIDPEFQRRGYGKRMIGVLTEWARLTQNPIVVLGEPAFYTKAGFSQTQSSGLQSPYPASHLMIAGTGQTTPKAELIFPKALDGV